MKNKTPKEIELMIYESHLFDGKMLRKNQTLDSETWNEIVYDVYEEWEGHNKEIYREYCKEEWGCDDDEFDDEFCYGGSGYEIFIESKTNQSLIKIKNKFNELLQVGYVWKG